MLGHLIVLLLRASGRFERHNLQLAGHLIWGARQMPRRHQYKWLGNQCIDQLRLDDLSKPSTVTLAVGDFLPTFGHVFGRTASPQSLAWQALLCHLPFNFGLNWDFAARDTRLDDRFTLGPNTSIAFDCSVAHEEMSVVPRVDMTCSRVVGVGSVLCILQARTLVHG